MVTLTQLEYVVAVDDYRHFATAAEKCFVTQPTLSMQIKKMEDDLGVILFDRSRQPVVPTDIGSRLIAQARVVLAAAGRLSEIIAEDKAEVAGSLKSESYRPWRLTCFRCLSETISGNILRFGLKWKKWFRKISSVA